MYKPLTSCVACAGSDLSPVFDFGQQTLANESVLDPSTIQQKYPLALNLCNSCNHLQLGCSVDPDILFKDYKYMSGVSQTMQDYYQWFVEYCSGFIPTRRSVLEIACNDGAQLDKFKEAGYKTYGIDPAQNLYSLSSANHQVVCDYLNATSISSFGRKFDLIVAQNVLAHTSDPFAFLNLCREYLVPGGLVLVQTSQADMVVNAEFDTIYHEHVSFFSIESMSALANRAGLKVVDVIKPAVHGTSFLFVLAHISLTSKKELLKIQGQITTETINRYKNKVTRKIELLQESFAKFKAIGHKLVGYGAAAKGVTLLNVCNLDLDYIVDDTPTKQGLYTSGKHIPIVPIEVLKQETHEKLIVVPLAWNFYDEIKQKLILEGIQTTLLKIHPGLTTESI